MSKFIELEAENIVSKLAQDETGKRQYYRPIYSLHKWWARRPGALFRAIILSAVNGKQPLFVSGQNGRLSLESNYFKDHDLNDTIILDPFMGGGTTLAEANRLGAKVIGCDLNPVSFWLVRETLKPINLEKLEHYFQQLQQSAGERIKELYRTACRHCYLPADTLYAFWVRLVACPRCQCDTLLFKRSLLNEGLSRNKPVSAANPATVFCPCCFQLNDWNGKQHCLCQYCHYLFDPTQGTYDQGYYTCQHCHQSKISLLETLQDGKKLRERLVAIEYGCRGCGDRFYKSPDETDLANIATVEKTVTTSWQTLLFPRQKILPGDSSVRWRQHNYHHYYEVFNPRQILAFNYLIKGIQEIPEEVYRHAFITIFSNSLEYNNMMTPYNYPHRKLHHLFNYHAMPLTTTPVENAVWGVGAEGAGTFINCYGRYLRAKQYGHKPFDKFKDKQGVVQTVWSGQETIAAHFVGSFEELKQTPRGAMLFCRDSSHLPAVPDKSVDFVITDPPYYDSIHYSELSNFFYVWLRAIVDHPYFANESVPTQAEAIVNETMAKGEKEYQELLAGVFREGHRVLKDNGKLIFTFHNTKWLAWWTVLKSLEQAGFRVVDSFPVMSEYKVNPHIRNKQAMDMDLVLVCQKQSIPVEPLSIEPIEVLQRTAENLTDKTSKNSDYELFLHFMGELLRTAGSDSNRDKLNYDWFTEALTHFNDFAADLKRSREAITYQVNEPRQLRLLEAD
jgi:adenine-specific DNA methylase